MAVEVFGEFRFTSNNYVFSYSSKTEQYRFHLKDSNRILLSESILSNLKDEIIKHVIETCGKNTKRTEKYLKKIDDIFNAKLEKEKERYSLVQEYRALDATIKAFYEKHSKGKKKLKLPNFIIEER